MTPRTKMIIVNTPHNPVGKVFTRRELELIAQVAEEHNLIVMSDEVVSIAPWSLISVPYGLRSCSTMPLCLIQTSMSALPRFLACGTAP